MPCDQCGVENSTVCLEPTGNQLLFGGYPVRMEHRCSKCDRKLSKRLDKVLENLTRECDENPSN